MFSKILVANRGEIACRIIKTAHKMGIKTVAVYSQADCDAMHVSMANEAVLIGPPPASESYLLIDKIIAACKETGAEAVHPGYGFLSERAAFVEALTAENIVFIGPGAKAIEAMGDKIESKKYARAAGVSTVPGHLGIIETSDEAVAIAKDIGFPVMIKASAGGGGKGMRVAHSVEEVADGFERARSEAASSFGDDRVFIEKFIENPRHIEIQLIADGHGNVVYLGERECSIQRRNQKIIEEAPSPLLDDKTRKTMGEQACALARTVDYQSAGTVEFVSGQDKKFYFLEMNTRLQVEHPVTEMVTGLDLVEQMIRVAAGEKLPFSQDDIMLNGWAIESRVYAEDPYRNFMPSTGRLVRYEPPSEGRERAVRVRNDTGVQAGSEISMFYDPMIAKLVVHGADRLAAIDGMSRALDRFVIDGIGHNIPFLSAVMRHPRWRKGELSTGFIGEEYPDGFGGLSIGPNERRVFVAAALAMELVRKDRLDRLPGRLRPHSGIVQEDWVVKLDREMIDVQLFESQITRRHQGEARHALIHMMIDIDGEHLTIDSNWRPGGSLWQAKIDDVETAVQVRVMCNGHFLSYRGAAVEARVMNKRIAALDSLMPIKELPDTSCMLLCPMPGIVVSIDVEVGQEVKAGETLAIVEAMKMENVLRAERDLVIASIHAEAGDSLAVDAVIMEFE